MTSAIERVVAALDDIRRGKMVILVDDYGNEIDEAVATENTFLERYVTLPLDLRLAVGYRFEDLIRGCVINGKNCKKER